ncbi:MAG: trypsin-like peptidase domain-containing protein [Pyrinomonadaceae bacterium]
MRSLSRVTAVVALLSLATLATSSPVQEGREIARNAFPSVVLVLAENAKAHRTSLGSGFFIRDNLIVTNYHVIKGSLRISVKLVGHEDAYRAQVVRTSIAKDLALIRVIDIEAPPLAFADLDDVAVGDQVYATSLRYWRADLKVTIAAELPNEWWPSSQ